ncbi:E3 ubiquitin-protein ligase RING1-like [Quillaja saponaria]|uniref:RING-type E3 ubiquitin transferase n=1 Tax=Quillaja saponaria TaxID=32244 RepID=A0AAD7PZ38_QUISA|nr:E3 ubiquitin-protein ligase RING1-like [Quillaja saponaria]
MEDAVAGSFDPNTQNPSQNYVGSLGDFLRGPGFDLVLRSLAENYQNRYGSPPTKKAIIKAMPSVTIKEDVQCTICLEDIDISNEAKEMSCKHKFHTECILQWLELRSSCPLCRFQMPSYDNYKIETNGFRSGNEMDRGNDQVRAEEERIEYGRRNCLPFLWPSGCFFSSRFRIGGSSSISLSADTSSQASLGYEN